MFNKDSDDQICTDEHAQNGENDKVQKHVDIPFLQRLCINFLQLKMTKYTCDSYSLVRIPQVLLPPRTFVVFRFVEHRSIASGITICPSGHLLNARWRYVNCFYFLCENQFSSHFFS